LTTLERLIIFDSDVTDAGLAHLKSYAGLKELYIEHADIGDSGLQGLKSITGLNRLFLSDTKATTAGVFEIQRALPKCNVTVVTP